MRDTTATSVGSEEVRLVMDPAQETLDFLHHRIEFSISSGFHEEGEAETVPTAGSTTVIGGDVISVVICGDSIWPLLVEGYSNDEQAMCAFVVASTIIHEIAVGLFYMTTDRAGKADREMAARRQLRTLSNTCASRPWRD